MAVSCCVVADIVPVRRFLYSYDVFPVRDCGTTCIHHYEYWCGGGLRISRAAPPACPPPRVAPPCVGSSASRLSVLHVNVLRERRPVPSSVGTQEPLNFLWRLRPHLEDFLSPHLLLLVLKGPSVLGFLNLLCLNSSAPSLHQLQTCMLEDFFPPSLTGNLDQISLSSHFPVLDLCSVVIRLHSAGFFVDLLWPYFDV